MTLPDVERRRQPGGPEHPGPEGPAEGLRADCPPGSGVFSSVPNALFATDAEWRVTFVNRHAERLLQRPCETLLGEDIWAACPAFSGTRFEDAFRQAVRDGASARFTEYYAPTATWYDVNAVPFEGGLSVYLADTTDRERRGNQLRLLQEAVEASPNGVVITAAAAGGYGVLYVNPGSAGPRRFKLPISLGELSVEGATVVARLVEI